MLNFHKEHTILYGGWPYTSSHPWKDITWALAKLFCKGQEKKICQPSLPTKGLDKSLKTILTKLEDCSIRQSLGKIIALVW